jgi:hypothetical protein
MSLYDSTGGFDGFTIFETDQINEVCWGNREHKAIELLVNNSSSKPLLCTKRRLLKRLLLQAISV